MISQDIFAKAEKEKCDKVGKLCSMMQLQKTGTLQLVHEYGRRRKGITRNFWEPIHYACWRRR
ncbi:hypothetical protein AGR6A_Lc40012 [Agrobacterium sp. NCPPB 925]|nr:hypothetical protein AGR6A_Lc40012 [Agrobacterium sp. NCPPB 925]